MTKKRRGNIAPENTLKMTRLFSFFVLLLIIVATAFLSFRVMQAFVLPLFLAALLVVVFQPFHQWVLARCQGRAALAAGLTTASIWLVVLVPLAWLITIGVKESIELAHLTSPQKIGQQLGRVRERLNLKIPYAQHVNEIDDLIESLRVPEHLVDPAVVVSPTAATRIILDHRSQLDLLKQRVVAFDQQLADEEMAIDGKNPPRRADESVAGGYLQQRIANARPQLRNILERADGRHLVDELIELVDGLTPESATRTQTFAYQRLVDEIGDHFRNVRISLLGVIWGPVLQFSNPTDNQLADLQTTITETLRGWLLKLTGQTPSLMGSLLLQFFILTVATYYFLIDGQQMVNSAIELSPMEDHYEHEMIAEFAKLSRAVVLATWLSALAQGLLAGIGYFAVWGFQSLVVLVIVTTLLAMIPFVGAAAVWVPVCLALAFLEGRYFTAGLLACWGFFVVSMADNVIKPYVLKGQSNLHPLFALLSVIGGVKALGPIGVLVGPMIVAFLQSLLNILRRVLHRLDDERAGETTPTS